MRNSISNVAAAVFDLDGTLFDSVSLWHEIDDIFLGRRGIVPDDEYRHAIAAIGFTATAHFTVEYYKLDDTPERLIEEWTELAAHAYAHDVKLLRGAREYLSECKKSGVKIVALTSLRADFALSCLKNNGIYDVFDRIFTTDDMGVSKSTPAAFELVARSVAVPAEQCVAFDDVSVAVISAKAAGMTTVAVAGKMFDVEKAGHAADFIIPDLARAPRLIRNS